MSVSLSDKCCINEVVGGPTINQCCQSLALQNDFDPEVVVFGNS
jgi:hypothetical protein